MELEELLVQEGVAAPPDQIRGVIERALGDGRNPVAALVEEGVVVEDVLAEVLARACGTVVFDLERGLIEEAAPHTISGALAREHLALPVAAPSGGKLRVVFVDPLDSVAREAVERSAGLAVQPLVGTLTGLRAAIERAYAGRTTRVVKPPTSRGEMPHEITRRVPSPEAPSNDTAPLHRLEQEATPEQRHEALLLALIERGILTRADYAEALKRLLSGRRDE